MGKIKKVLLWLLVGFFLLVAFAFMPSVSSFVALAVAVIIAPIEKWQDVLGRFVKGKIKALISVVLVVVMFVAAPTIPTEEPNNKTVSTTSAITTQAIATENTTETEVVITTESATTDTTENTQAETNEAVTSDEVITTEAANIKPTIAVDTTAHVHNFAAASCTSPKTCTSCGETSGSALGHSWAEATYSSPQKCTVCGATHGSALDVPYKENYHGHVYTGGSSSKRYHYEAHCAGNNSHEITWDEVERRGLTPCGTCVLK